MAGKPIDLTEAEVRAILEGRKTMMRLVLKPCKPRADDDYVMWPVYTPERKRPGRWHAPDRAAPYHMQDRLWVREAWARVGDNDDDIHACPDLRVHAYYRQDVTAPELLRWRTSTQMPRWASRLTLIVEAVKVERVQDISADDAEKEGLWRGKARRHLFWENLTACRLMEGQGHKTCFRDRWNATKGKRPGLSWNDNPWVAAVTFRPVIANIDRLTEASA